MPTDTEQDLLRAMVVFAGAGLDSMTKQLVKDTLPKVLAADEQARAGLQKFTIRRLRREVPGEDTITVNLQMLSEVLLSERPQDELVKLLIDELTGGSLQSSDELLKTISYLGLTGEDVGLRPGELKPVFDCRNQIIHELDIDFSAKRRDRFLRKRADMVRYARQLLELSSAILSGVDKRLTAPVSPR